MIPNRTFDMTTVGSNGSAIAQSDVWCVEGFFAGVYVRRAGQPTTLDVIVRDSSKILLTQSNISADGLYPDTAPTVYLYPPIDGTIVVQVTGGDSNVALSVDVYALETLP